MFKEKPATPRSISLRKPIFSVGINDANYITNYKKDGKSFQCPYYTRWRRMIERCYSSKFHEKHPQYKKCHASSEWLIFSNFKKWMEKQNWYGMDLDKDLKIKGNKLYSKETCIFIPHDVNAFLTQERKNKGSLPTGIDVHKKSGKLRVRCGNGRKQIHIGLYNTEKEAKNAYLEAKSNFADQLSYKYPEISKYLTKVSEYTKREMV